MDTKNKLADSSGRMTRLVRRLSAACRTHDTQVSACILLSGPQVIAAIMAGAPWWACVLVGLIWPAVAFLANFANPIPPNAESIYPESKP